MAPSMNWVKMKYFFFNIIDFGKRKKYVMVTTKSDGTKVKEYLDPEDPRISEIGITKRFKPSSASNVNVIQGTSANESIGINYNYCNF